MTHVVDAVVEEEARRVQVSQRIQVLGASDFGLNFVFRGAALQQRHVQRRIFIHLSQIGSCLVTASKPWLKNAHAPTPKLVGSIVSMEFLKVDEPRPCQSYMVAVKDTMSKDA